jgi:hypothetical protein
MHNGTFCGLKSEPQFILLAEFISPVFKETFKNTVTNFGYYIAGYAIYSLVTILRKLLYCAVSTAKALEAPPS